MDESLNVAARRFLEERRRGLESPSALDAYFERFAQRVVARQPRCDLTIFQLPLLTTPATTDTLPIFHNGSTYQVLAGGIPNTAVIGSNANLGPLGIYNVKFYGAKGDGVTDDTLAIQEAITACQVTGGTVLFPPGEYLISAPLQVTGGPSFYSGGVSIVGSGQSATTILVSGDINAIEQTNQYPSGSDLAGFSLRDLTILYAAQATSGTAVTLYWASDVHIKNVTISYCFDAVQFGQSSSLGVTTTIGGAYLDGCDIRNVAGGAIIVRGNGGGLYISNTEFGGTGETVDNFGIDFSNAYFDTIFLRGLDFEQFGNGINIACLVANSGLADAFFDSIIVDGVGLGPALNFEAQSGGTIMRVKLSRLWLTTSSGSSVGELVTALSGGSIVDITHTQCNFSGTSAGVSVTTQGTNGTISDITYDYCQAYGSVTGFDFGNGTRLALRNSSSGSPYSGCTYGVQVGDTVTSCRIQNNDLTNNSTAGLLNNLTAAAGAVSIISGNIGYNPVGAMTAPAVTTGTYTYTNTSGVDQTLNVSGGTVSAISANGVATGLTSGQFFVPAGKTLVITNTVIPTVTVSGN